MLHRCFNGSLLIQGTQILPKVKVQDVKVDNGTHDILVKDFGASGFPVGANLPRSSRPIRAALSSKPGLFSKRRLTHADADDSLRKA